MNVCFVTFIYPAAIKFFANFLKSIQRQTDKNFTLIVFNDGCIPSDLSIFYKQKNLNIDIIDNAFDSISQNRVEAMKILSKKEFDGFIFGDIDDQFSNNRVQVLRESLKKHEFVFNELNLLNINLISIESNLVGNNVFGDYISFDMIKEKNMIGFSHMALQKSAVQYLADFSIKNDVKVVDWIFVTRLLKRSKAYFEKHVFTNYIQHESNLAIIQGQTIEELFFELDVKIKHYKELQDLDSWFIDERNELIKLNSLLEVNENLQEKWILRKKNRRSIYPWWNQFKDSEELKNELCI